jgi:uncharacterized protein
MSDNQQSDTGPGAEKIATLNRFYSAFNSGDMEGAFACLSPDIEWIYHGPRDRIPFAGTFTGHDGVRDFFQRVVETIELVEMAPETFEAAGDTVYGTGIEHSRSLLTGREYRLRWAHIYKVEAGVITRFEEFLDTATVAGVFS